MSGIALDQPDWNDVVRRARRRGRRRHAAEAVLALALVVVGVASAYALGHPVVDFGRAPHAGLREVDDFGSIQVTAPPGLAPGVLPRETRRITTVRFDGKSHTLYVAPTRLGGDCYQWSGVGGGCSRTRHQPLGMGGQYQAGVLRVLEGTFSESRSRRLTVRFADGATEDVPFVWVTAPVDEGFYLWRVPNAHRTLATRAVSLSLYDGRGKLLERQSALGPTPWTKQMVMHRAPGFPPVDLERDADWSRRELLFDVRTPRGVRVGLFVVPKPGGECFATNNGSGCLPARKPKSYPLMNLSISGANQTICCDLSPRIVRIEARFQDGERVELAPKHGWLLWPIPASHWALGHRLVALVGYDATGRAIARARLLKPADQRGTYPCAKQRSYGYGVTECP